MAATSAFTKRAYEAQLAHIYRIQNKQIRDIVLEFVVNPKATAFGQSSDAIMVGLSGQRVEEPSRLSGWPLGS